MPTSNAWKKQFDNVWPTNSPHLLCVLLGGKCGVYNSNDNTFPVTLVYDGIGDTNFPYLWIVKQGGKYGVYNSDKVQIMLLPVFYNVDMGAGDIFKVSFTRRTSFKFNVKKRLWEDPQAVIMYCTKNKKDMLPWAHLYTTKPEQALRYVQGSA